MRGLRGITVPASEFGPRSFYRAPEGLPAYWLSYRKNASEYGMTVILGTRHGDYLSYEDFLMDMNLHTPGDFSDAFLLPGFTYSDYEADTHITTISKGGVAPMEYLNVVVNLGTVASGEAQAPDCCYRF
jgi:hypothetical protein